MCSSLEPLAHGEVDEEVDTAVDGEAEVADSKHGAGHKDYENITDDNINYKNNTDKENHNEDNNRDGDSEYLNQGGIPGLWASSSLSRYSAKLRTSL